LLDEPTFAFAYQLNNNPDFDISGIFPSKCAVVPPREITKEELVRVRVCQKKLQIS
jgi:hypothetical protein